MNRQLRFVNQFQPQTLVMATMLCYIQAVFGALFSLFSPVALLLAVGLGAGGYGIANEKRWGYLVACGLAILQLAALILLAGTEVLRFPLILNLLFDGALVALLLHPQSREYQHIWFK